MNRVLIGKVNALSLYAAWLLFLTSLLWLAYKKLFGHPGDSAMSFILLFGAFVISGWIHLVLSFFVRCPSCGKRITQGPHKPHPASAGRSKLVLHWFSGSVVCIHCGNPVNTNAL